MPSDRAERLIGLLIAVPIFVIMVFWDSASRQYDALLQGVQYGPGRRYVQAFVGTTRGPELADDDTRAGEIRESMHRTLRVKLRGHVEYWDIGGGAGAPGPSAAALGDSDLLARLEEGEPPVSVEPALAAPGSFAALYLQPNLDGLRRASLSASAKLFLLERMPGDIVPLRTHRVLSIAAELEDRGYPATIGYHELSDGLAYRQPDGEYVLWTDQRPTAATRWQADDDFDLYFGPAPMPGAVWSDSDKQGYSGCWSVVPIHGPTWWDVPRYRSWLTPLLVGSLLYLCITFALRFVLRRRRQLDATRVRFLTEVAHDLRTPLTAVRLHAELLAEKQDDPQRRRKYIGVLEREASRASTLLANLLDLSSLERGSRRFTREKIELEPVFTQCAEQFRQLYPGRADDLELVGSADQCAYADATALARCINNLLDNAGKYTDAGTPILLCWERAGERGGQSVRIEVQDAGEGVPAEDAPRMFDRYARGSNTDGVSGTGLGLSLVRELAEGMGGSVKYETNATGGCFELMLPGESNA